MQSFETVWFQNNMVDIYKQRLSDNLFIIIIMLSDMNIVPDSQIDYKFVLNQVIVWHQKAANQL